MADITKYIVESSTGVPSGSSASNIHGYRMQVISLGEDIPAQWWELFHSKPLDALIQRAIKNSPTLAAARAALNNAREQRRAQAGALYFPSIDLGLSYTKEKFNAVAIGFPEFGATTFDLYDASVNVSYVFDFFGGSRRQVEAMRALEQYQNFQLEAAYLTLTANIVTTAVREASLRAQLSATKEISSMQEKQLDIMVKQFNEGATSLTEVLTQRTLLAQIQATVPQLEKQIDSSRHLLAVLTGVMPGPSTSPSEIPEFNLEEFTLPEKLPVSVPALLVRHRPDIRAQEALMHQSSALIGVADAGLLPSISITGNESWESNTTNSLISNDNNTWEYIIGLQQPIFHGGAITAKRRAALAAYDEAAAQYRQTVLIAFENVADSLRALEKDTATLAAQTQARDSANKSLEVVGKQFTLGAVSYPILLIAQQQYQQAEVNFVQAQAALFADTAALFQALGGGWWNHG
jgi:NodT family efflux transporter outer membrane factor (OMF) lipoprotein